MRRNSTPGSNQKQRGRPRFKKDTSPHVRECKTVLDSGLHAVDSGFRVVDSRSFSVEVGFRIPIVSWILDSYTCIPDSKTHDSRFPKQHFPGFRIPHANISRIPESEFPYKGRDTNNSSPRSQDLATKFVDHNQTGPPFV